MALYFSGIRGRLAGRWERMAPTGNRPHWQEAACAAQGDLSRLGSRTMTTKTLTLDLLAFSFAIARLDPQAAIPAWAQAGALASVTRTPTELSVVCQSEQVPDTVHAQRGYRCLRVLGPLEFSAIGVLASLAAPLAGAGISIFALSTYDTDYLLLQERELDAALACLAQAGHQVRPVREG